MELLCQKNLDIKTRKFIGVIFKSIIKDNWDTYGNNLLRERMFNLISLIIEETEIAEVIALILVDLINKDDIEIWEFPLRKLINNIVKENNSNNKELLSKVFIRCLYKFSLFCVS